VPRLTVSVALCTHNGAGYLAKQLLSILGQTAPPDEIVLSDDASRDDTVDIAERVVSEWRVAHPGTTPRFQVVRNTAALGVTANFEGALAACVGDVIALSDQDDVWLPKRLEIMVGEFARRPDLDLLHSDARLVDGEGDDLGTTLLGTLGVTAAVRAAEHSGHAFDLLLRRNVVTGATALVRRDLVLRARPFPEAWVHDEWLAMVAAATGVVDVLDEALVDYRQHDANQIGVTALDAAGHIGRLRAPRTLRNKRLLARAEALAERAPAFVPAPDSDRLGLIEAKLVHERMRSALPAPRVARVWPVLREWATGRYSRFGRGLQDVLRDLVQPV
jgi:glycosyltransferase involved in cell wall biosynthesis